MSNGVSASMLAHRRRIAEIVKQGKERLDHVCDHVKAERKRKKMEADVDRPPKGIPYYASLNNLINQ